MAVVAGAGGVLEGLGQAHCVGMVFFGVVVGVIREGKCLGCVLAVRLVLESVVKVG